MAFITVAGENQIATKQGAELALNMADFVLANIAGLGAEPVDRVEAMPDSGDIVATLPITKSGYVNTNQVVYSLVLDSSVGDFDFNWIGLVDDEGVLIAVTYVPTISKIANDGGVQGNNLTRNFLLAYTGIQATTAIDVPAQTWQIDFNARLWGIDERERLSNLDIYGHEGFFDTAYQVVQQGSTTTYDILPGIAYVGGIRIESLATQTVDVTTPPAAVWLDVSLEGDISDVSAVVAIIADGANHTDYVDGNGFNHYVTKIADIAANGDATDARVISPLDVIPQPLAEAGEDTSIWAWTSQRVRQAINAIVKPATETLAGLVERATQAETDAGNDDTRYVSPKKLRFGFSILLATNGYIVLPSWMGGLIIQWANVGSVANDESISFNMTFPNNVFGVVLGDSNAGSTINNAHIIGYSNLGLSSFVSAVVRHDGTTNTTSSFSYISIGN